MSQRTFQKSLPTTTALLGEGSNFLPEANMEELLPLPFPLNCILLRATEESTTRTETFFVGEPSLRTGWEIETVSLAVSILARSLSGGEVESSKIGIAQLGLNIVSGADAYPFALTKVPFSNIQKLIKKGAFFNGYEYIERTQYVLENFSPITIPGGHDFSIELTAKTTRPPEQPATRFLALLEPIFQATVTQIYAPSRRTPINPRTT